MKEGQTRVANILLNIILQQSISYFDNYKSFYHGLLFGLFNDYNVQLNKESGDGTVLDDDPFGTSFIIECKKSAQKKYLKKIVRKYLIKDILMD